MARSLCVITAVFGAGILLPTAFSQQGGGTTTTSGGGAAPSSSIPGAGTSTTTRPPTSTNIPSPSTQTQQTPGLDRPEMNRAIFLSGKVRVDDGTPPGEQVVIERVCNGMARPEAYTDSKGNFSFELGRNQGMFADASVGNTSEMGSIMGRPGGTSSLGGMGGGSIGQLNLMACELRAVLPGFRSDVVSLANRRVLDSPDVGTIILHRLGNVEGRIISATTLNAPKDARKAYEKAQDLTKKKKYEEAVASLQKAVEVYPKYALAWFELGRLQDRLKQSDAARTSFQQAVAADPRYINPHMELAVIAARERNWQDLADISARAIKLDPFDYPQAFFYNSIANLNLNHLDAAEKSAREAQKLDSKHHLPKVDHLLGVILANKEDYTGAADQLRSYLKFAPDAQDAAQVRTQLADIEKRASSSKPAEGAAPPQ